MARSRCGSREGGGGRDVGRWWWGGGGGRGGEEGKQPKGSGCTSTDTTIPIVTPGTIDLCFFLFLFFFKHAFRSCTSG